MLPTKSSTNKTRTISDSPSHTDSSRFKCSKDKLMLLMIPFCWQIYLTSNFQRFKGYITFVSFQPNSFIVKNNMIRVPFKLFLNTSHRRAMQFIITHTLSQHRHSFMQKCLCHSYENDLHAYSWIEKKRIEVFRILTDNNMSNTLESYAILFRDLFGVIFSAPRKIDGFNLLHPQNHLQITHKVQPNYLSLVCLSHSVITWTVSLTKIYSRMMMMWWMAVEQKLYHKKIMTNSQARWKINW